LLSILENSVTGRSVITRAIERDGYHQRGRRAFPDAAMGAGIGGGMGGGALAGLLCGPGAPVCVAVGAFVGGLGAAGKIRMGLSLSALLDR
jgi:hypothetical protein